MSEFPLITSVRFNVTEKGSFVITQRPPKDPLEFKAGRAAQNTVSVSWNGPSADNG